MEYRLNASCNRIKTNECAWGIALLTMKMEGDWQAYDSELLSYDYGYNGIESLAARQLNPATYRLLDPGIGRWYQIDPAAESFYGLSPYVSMGNNPVVMVDPDGDFIVAALVGAAVGVLANGIVNSVNGNPFFQGWGMSTVMGAVGGAMGYGNFALSSMFDVSTFGAQALQGGLSVLNSYLPGYDASIGDMTFSVSPAFFSGSAGFGIGANFGVSVSSPHMDYGFTFGATAWSKHIFTGEKFLEKRFGAGFAVGVPGFKIGGGSTYFTGGGISQNTGFVTAYGVGRGGPWGIMYENDWMFGTGLADGGDRWRTAAFSIRAGDASLSIKLATGDPGITDRPKCIDCGPNGTYISQSANDFRLGSVTLGYSGYNIGVAGERVRNAIQNDLIHDAFGYARFKKLNNSLKINSFYKSRSMYTLW